MEHDDINYTFLARRNRHRESESAEDHTRIEDAKTLGDVTNTNFNTSNSLTFGQPINGNHASRMSW